MDESENRKVDAVPPDHGAPAPDRREALKRLGRYAAYTAPALVTLLVAERAAAVS